MVNLRTFTSLTYLSQIAFLGGDAHTDSSKLENIVPRREVLYVGGKYTEVTASSTFSHQVTSLTCAEISNLVTRTKTPTQQQQHS